MEKLYIKPIKSVLVFTIIFCFVLIYLISTSCKPRNNVEEFIGAWSYCEADSTYAECYILSDSSLCFFSNAEGEIYRKYKISADTLFIFSDNLSELNKLHIKDKTTDQIILIDENNNNFIFHKIYENIYLEKLLSKNIIEISIFSREFMIRSKRNCK